MYYYRHKEDRTAFVVAKTPLLEEEGLELYEEITEQEYNELQQSFEKHGNVEKAKEQANKERIAELKTLLRESDYKQAKWLDGDLSDEDYAPIKKARHDWRVEINRLEEELNND